MGEAGSLLQSQRDPRVPHPLMVPPNPKKERKEIGTRERLGRIPVSHTLPYTDPTVSSILLWWLAQGTRCGVALKTFHMLRHSAPLRGLAS